MKYCLGFSIQSTTHLPRVAVCISLNYTLQERRLFVRTLSSLFVRTHNDRMVN